VLATDTVRLLRPLRAALGALEDPFARVWFGSQLISASGTMTQTVATAWLVLQLTHSAADLGVLTILTLGPVLLCSVWSGGIADRVERRRLLAMTQIAFISVAVTLFILACLRVLGVALLFSLAAATGMVNAVDAPARQVYARDLVGEARISSAVTLYEVILNCSRIVGPAVGGLLLAVWGPSWCFLFNALTFIPPLAALGTAAARAQGRGGVPSPVKAGPWQGMRLALRDRRIRHCLLLAALSGVLFNTSVLFPVLAERGFGAGGGGYASLLAFFGIGALPGALVASCGTGNPTGRRVATLGWVTGLLMIAAASAPTLAICCGIVSIAGFASIWFIAVANTLVQIRSPAGSRGRVMGLWTMALPGMNPVTGVMFGLVADRFGARDAFGSGGVLLVACALLAWRSIGRKADTTSEMEMPE
jgi:MFS family permease